MSKVVIGAFVGLVAVSAGVCLLASHGSGKIRKGTYLGPVSVGGLSRQEARHKLESWWEREQTRSVGLTAPGMAHVRPRTLSDLGIRIDPAASVSHLPQARFLDFLIPKAEPVHISPAYRVSDSQLALVAAHIDAATSKPSPARVKLVGGRIQRHPEKSSLKVDRDGLRRAILNSLVARRDIEVPMIKAPKKVQDAALAHIVNIESEFTTHFSTAKKSRCANIRLAASKLDGLVLMPGERVSFNDTVGRRTKKNGFQIAGVYKDGKHDFDVGGGICQVSSTLYNAALYANLKIVRRQNHSMPVAYVPLGRDATVDYGSIDLLIENNYDRPIALASEYHPGRLTFRVLGQKDDSLSVKIESDGSETWDPGTKTVVDPSLPAGTKKVVEKGTSGRAIKTYRLVFKDGNLVRKESLGRSYYRGGQKIIAVGAPASKSEDKSPARLASADLD